MAKRVPANKDVLRWARNIRGLTRREAAEKIGIAEQELADIEERDLHPTVKVFNKMVAIYKQTESTLLLERPPASQTEPKDFRTAAGKQAKLSPETRLVIREAQELQNYVSEIVEDDPQLIERVTLPTLKTSQNAEIEARKERERLGMPLANQLRWTQRDSFENWREWLGQKGIIVLLKKMPWEDCRGFSLLDHSLLPTIVVNSEDVLLARSFTLFHEYAHLTLRTAAICTPSSSTQNSVERWCNHFAAAFLLPAQEFREHIKTDYPLAGRTHDWPIASIVSLASYYRVSRSVLALRLQELGLAVPDYYDRHRSELVPFDKMAKPPKPPKIKRRPGWREKKRLKEVGGTAASVIVAAWKKHIVDPMEAADILNLSLDELHGLQRQTEAQRIRDVS